MTDSKGAIAVFGAYGHTGRFVLAELRRRGWTPIASGRDARKLAALGEDEFCVASIDDPASLDRALIGAQAVVNCAGPFLDTARPVLEAALRARIPYLDLAAEQMAALPLFEDYREQAQQAGIAVIPAMAFYGGLADLLATAAMGDWTSADEILVAVALDSWHPTEGTRRTGERNTATRVVVSQGELVPLAAPSPQRQWDFPAPFGQQDVVGVPLSEIITISRHLAAREVHSFMNLGPLRDLGDETTPAPKPVDDSGRSAQTFLMDVIVRHGDRTRRAIGHGRDIYAITGPLVVEALERLLRAPPGGGVFAPGEIFDAPAFLASLAPGLTVEMR